LSYENNSKEVTCNVASDFLICYTFIIIALVLGHNKSIKGRDNMSNEIIREKYNRLISEKSPYLLQHANNPINWYAWGSEAFQNAEKENKPIFLSIGYSTCHWCHVMAHESFEDKEVAEFLNKNFIAIKVDKEERPDVDSIYMTVCQAMNGQGGWPLTIFMTPDQKPFYAGTYFPKNSRYGMPGLMDILKSVKYEWSENKDKIISSSEKILSQLEVHFNSEKIDTPLNEKILDNGFNQLFNNFDKIYGGFGGAPKFPTPHKLMFLLRYYSLKGEEKALAMAEKTLDSMYTGGIFDHIGFGFSRYSTDEKWLAPHFEKMLYDNALLIMAYLEAYQITKKELYKNVAVKSLEYVFKELTSEDGGFYCAQDADSEGEEGKYYVFKPSEIIEILGEEDGKYFNNYLDITEEGNFEGNSIPNLINNNSFNKEDERIKTLRDKVLQYRSGRMKLHKDDKILTSWNGLMIATLGKAYKILGDKKYFDEANNALNTITKNLVTEDGRLLARYRDGESLHKGYLDDYAFLTLGLIELYESSFDVTYLTKAVNLNNEMIKLFWDNEKGGFFIYGNDGENLIARPKEVYDGAMPSGNSVVAYNLIKLARLRGDSEMEEMAEKQMNFMASNLGGGELNYSFFLMAATFALSPSKELVCVLKNEDDINSIKIILKGKTYFNLTTIVKTKENAEELGRVAKFTQDYKIVNNKDSYYLCENKSCLPPVNDISSIQDKFDVY